MRGTPISCLVALAACGISASPPAVIEDGAPARKAAVVAPVALPAAPAPIDAPPPNRSDRDGKKHGLWTERGTDGVLLVEQTYQHGELDGPYRRWSAYPPHRLQVEGAYARDKPDGVWLRYDDEGRKRVRESYSAGVAHGSFEYFDDTGLMVGRSEMDRGSGAWVAYSTWGTKEAEGELVAGLAYNRWGERNPVTGEWEAGAYRAGTRIGPWTIHADVGAAKRAEGGYLGRQRTGPWQFWRDDGTLLASGSFAADAFDGEWVIHDDAGAAVVQRLRFRRGALTHVDGKPASLGYVRAFGSAHFEHAPARLVEDHAEF